MPLLIAKRQAMLGGNITIQPRVMKEEQFSRFAIPITGVTLDEAEFGSVLLSPKLAHCLYKHYKGREPEPASEVLQFITVNSFSDAQVTLYLGRSTMKLPDCRVVNNRIALVDGGISQWSFKLQVLPELDDHVKQLFQKLRQQIQIELACETYGAQPQLPLEEEEPEGDEDADEDGEEAADAAEGEPQVSTTGAKIQRASRKKRGQNESA